MKVRINRNGQITIPWLLRTWMRTKAGDTFEIKPVGLQCWQIRPLVLRYPWGEVRRVKSLLASLLIVLSGCTTGSVILTGTPRPAITPEAVKLYSEMPIMAEVIGELSSTSGSGWTSQQTKDYALRDLKKRAAKVGANGIVILHHTDPDAWNGATVTGKAIFVK